MRVVILTGPFYPRMNPPAGCINKYLDHLARKNEVVVVSQKSGYNYPPYDNPGIEFHTVSNWANDLRNWCEYNLTEGNSTIKAICTVLLYFIRLYGLLIEYFVYPTRLSWLIKKYFAKLVELNDVKPFDVIISVSNPVCAHLASQKFKKKYPRVKWITYSTDPFTYYPTVYKNVLFKSRRKIRNFETELDYYNSADYNVFTEELYGSAITDFAQKREKSICFPYVFTDFTRNIKTEEATEVHKRLRLVYAGALRKEIRNPEFALSVLKDMEDVEFHLYQSGNCQDIIKEYASKNIFSHNPLKRAEYIDLICNEADINVNIGNNSRLQAPSKLYELLSTGKPIINFYVEKNSQYTMIEKYPLGINIGVDTENSREKIQRFCLTIHKQRMTLHEIMELFPENTIEKQSEILDKLIEG